MTRLGLVLAGVLTGFSLCAHQVSAATTPTDTDPFSMLSSLQTQAVNDDSLATMRGRYIAPAQVPAGIPLAGALTTRSPQAFATQTGVHGIDSGAFAGFTGGQVTYFGIQMVSSWSVQDGALTQGVSVGSTIGVDASTKTVTISNWSSSTNGGLPTLNHGGNSYSGTPPANNVVGGVGQSIQVAGNDNDVVNSATLVVSANGPPSIVIVPTTTTCGSVCTTTVGADSVDIAISTGAGVASQRIGPGGITQSVQLAGNGNAILNSMQLNAQIAASKGFSAASLLPILQTMNWVTP